MSLLSILKNIHPYCEMKRDSPRVDFLFEISWFDLGFLNLIWRKKLCKGWGNKPIFHRTKIESDSPGVVDFIKWSSILKPVQEIVSRQLASCVVDQPILNPMCIVCLFCTHIENWIIELWSLTLLFYSSQMFSKIIIINAMTNTKFFML